MNNKHDRWVYQGKLIFEYRKKKGWSQAQLTKEVKASDKLISSIEKGNRGVSANLTPVFCRILGIDYNLFMNDASQAASVIKATIDSHGVVMFIEIEELIPATPFDTKGLIAVKIISSPDPLLPEGFVLFYKELPKYGAEIPTRAIVTINNKTMLATITPATKSGYFDITPITGEPIKNAQPDMIGQIVGT